MGLCLKMQGRTTYSQCDSGKKHLFSFLNSSSVFHTHLCFLSSVEESALEFLMYLVLLLKQPCQWDSYYYPFPTFRGFNCPFDKHNRGWEQLGVVSLSMDSK